MKKFVNDIWKMMLVRGIALLLFGLATVVWPGLTLVSLAVFFAVYVLVTGVTDILISIGAGKHKRAWFVTFVLGIIEVGVGVYLLGNPGLILSAFIVTVGVMFIVQGIFAIIASFIDTADAGMRLLEIAGGLIGIIAGFVVLQHPISGGIAFAWILGVYGLIAGSLTIAGALSLRSMTENVEKTILPGRAVAR